MLLHIFSSGTSWDNSSSELSSKPSYQETSATVWHMKLLKTVHVISSTHIYHKNALQFPISMLKRSNSIIPSILRMLKKYKG